MAEKKKKGRPSKEELARRQAEKERELKKERRRAGKAVALMALGVFFFVLAVYKEESAAVWVAMRGFLFGVLGMILGVPVCAFFAVIIDETLSRINGSSDLKKETQTKRRLSFKRMFGKKNKDT